jgi:hypothetical protein
VARARGRPRHPMVRPPTGPLRLCFGLRLVSGKIGTSAFVSFERFRSIENKKFPTCTNKNKPRSDIRDAKQRTREIRSTYPYRSHSGNVQINVVGLVVLASPHRDQIRSDPSATTGDASERCTRTAQRRLLLLGSARYGGVVDGISSTTAWCL